MREKWKEHPVFTRFEISTHGRVRRIGGKILNRCINVYGYVQCILSPGRINKKVHVLVLETFIGLPKKGQESRHLNGIRSDNRLENLCWGTHQENIEDRSRHGNTCRGSRNGNAKYTEPFVLHIRSLYDLGLTQIEIAKKLGITQPCVSRLINKGWRHLSETRH